MTGFGIRYVVWNTLGGKGLAEKSVRPTSQGEEVSDELLSLVGEDAFGVELHAFHGILAVAETHDHLVPIALGGVRADFEFGWELVFGNDQGVIPGGGHGRGDALKNGAAVVF